MVRMRSPGCRPARSAGLSGTTSRTHPYSFGIGLFPQASRHPKGGTLDAHGATFALALVSPRLSIDILMIITARRSCVKLFVTDHLTRPPPATRGAFCPC